MSVDSPVMLLLAVAVAVTVLAIVGRRRGAWLLALAAFCFIAATAAFSVRLDRPATVAVLIDASPSTRGAWFRDLRTARETIDRLAPRASIRLFQFADSGATPISDEAVAIADEQAVVTRLPAVDADAVLLLSDGHFEQVATSAVPVYPILRDGMSPDARIGSVSHEGGRLVAVIHNAGGERRLTWPDGQTTPVPTGSIRLSHTTTAGRIALDPGDAWPENDTAHVGPPPAPASEQWWIGSAAPGGFRAVEPSSLSDESPWLDARVIVLNNQPADAIPARARAALARYVRDSGGAVVLVGGNSAFSAGGYDGTELDAISPLASAPETAGLTCILIDASGSMAGVAADGRTRFEVAVDAAGAVATALPSGEAVVFASFARDLRWWPATTTRTPVSPTAPTPGGPTNLHAALEAIAARPAADRPRRVILLTDGDADLGDTDSLASTLRDAAIEIDWVALTSTADAPLAHLVEMTGGTTIPAGSTANWQANAVAGIRAAGRMPADPALVEIAWTDGTFDTARQVNRVLPRQDAIPLASTAPDGRLIAARWRVGLGQVTAVACAASAERVQDVAASIAASPADPRYRVEWQSERVIVEAFDDNGPMNDRPIALRIADQVTPLDQTAPGRYEAPIPRHETTRTATIIADGGRIGAITLIGRSPSEFERIGIDRERLATLARQTGGRLLVEPDDRLPSFDRLARLDRPLILLAGLATAVGLIALLRR